MSKAHPAVPTSQRSGRLRIARVASLLTAVALLALAGCGGSSGGGTTAGGTTTAAKSAGTVNLTFFTIPVNNTPVIQTLIQQFEKSHPNVKVKVELGPNNVDTVRGTLATRISSGSDKPDVYEGDVMWPAQFAKDKL
ncbi:MAG: trehalose/maltose transport system substrate-binding protein, partial [Frankiaceae bacterium]|nr:trehalose/maltose transport system substrate-binding protein [Frankiaceae bacterium]